VIAHHAEVVVVDLDLSQIVGTDGVVLDRELVALAGTVVGDGQCFGGRARIGGHVTSPVRLTVHYDPRLETAIGPRAETAYLRRGQWSTTSQHSIGNSATRPPPRRRAVRAGCALSPVAVPHCLR